MEIPWLQINISNSLFFIKLQFVERCYNSEPRQDNSWISMSEMFFLIFKRRALALLDIVNMVCLNFHTQVRNTFSRVTSTIIFKPPSNFFCLDLKITISGFFFTLCEILFAFNQLTGCLKSALICLFSFLTELVRHKRLVSSAKETLQNFIAWLRSFISSKSRRGLRTDSWGTSQFIAARPDSYPFMDTYWFHLDR